MAPLNKFQKESYDRSEMSSDCSNNSNNHSDELIGTSKTKLISVFDQLYATMPETVEGRVLYISRHGESMYNLDNRIGGNPDLSLRGLKYAQALGEHINDLEIPNLRVWISELRRTHQTSKYIYNVDTIVKPELNEISSGQFDDLTYEEFEQIHPEEFKAREHNKLTYRYPGGESYVDVCKRLEPVLPVLDAQNNLLVVTHQAVIRCILAFLLRTPDKEIPYTKVPLHTILKITFTEGRNEIEYYKLPVDCVDTYRPKTVEEEEADLAELEEEEEEDEEEEMEEKAEEEEILGMKKMLTIHNKFENWIQNGSKTINSFA